MKKLIIFVVSVLYFIRYTPDAHAINEFSTSYDSTYVFNPDGKAQINHEITLKNNIAHIYPREYTIAVRDSNLNDITVQVNQTSEIPKIEKTEMLTTINIPITHPSIGKDQLTVIEIRYNSSSLAEKIGSTYTITIPKAQKGNESESFVRRISVPQDYPPHSQSSLTPQSIEEKEGRRYYTYIGHGSENLTLLLGNSVTYHLSLLYELKNNTNNNGFTEIALPPDTNYQKIILNDLNPKPSEIVVDQDGNWLARYPINYFKNFSVKADLYITVSPFPDYYDPSTSFPTHSAKYWEKTKIVESLAEQLKTPRNIYNYLVGNLTYNYAQIKRQDRLGATLALEQPSQAICTEFTDTFVALARSQKIPSRAIIGYAYSQNPNLRPQISNQDILHSYPEYYDTITKRWHSIDPTWGHTTDGLDYFDNFDFSHITFVRLGKESTYPLAAGSYRNLDSTRQIDIDIVDSPPQLSPQFEQRGDYLINTGKVSLVNTNNVTYLPPFGKYLIQSQVSPPSKISFKTKTILLCIIILCATLFSRYYLQWRRFIRLKS